MLKKDLLKLVKEKALEYNLPFRVTNSGSGYITFKSETDEYSSKINLRWQFHSLLTSEGLTLILKRFEPLFYSLVDERLLDYYDTNRSVTLVFQEFYNHKKSFEVSQDVNSLEEILAYLDEYCKGLRFYVDEIFPKFSDIRFYAEYIAVPFEKHLERQVGGSYPVQLFKKLTILKWGGQDEKYEEYKQGLREYIKEDFFEPRHKEKASLYEECFQTLTQRLEEEPNPYE